LSDIIYPGLETLHELGGPAVTTNAARFMLAIALTESGPQLNARYQGSPSTSPGPARGWWQFEQGGGVHGVLTHGSSSALAKKVCDDCSTVAAEAAVWRSLEGHDVLATAFARLLITTTPKALPTNASDAYQQYLDLWRPGKPCTSATWTNNWNTADQACQQSPKS
jgi:hypothetical protein